MNMKTLQIILIASIFAFSCASEDDMAPAGMDNMVMDMLPANTDKNGMGTFTSYAHSLAGKAILLTDDAGKRVVRLEDFTMTSGPDVYVFVSKSNNYSQANVIEVAKLTSGYTDSDINFDFDSSAYTSDYKFVLVYCIQYNSLFGFAELK
jgi:hypothetical protein